MTLFIINKKGIHIMKYSIYYSCPYDIHRYKMYAVDEEQLLSVIKMLIHEKAYNINVEVNHED